MNLKVAHTWRSACGTLRRARSLFARIHGDEQGTISIASVFALMLLAFLLGMVINSGLAIDHKVRMQNAADAGTYSGGVVLARGMNTLAFTNHLLFDVFALTAYLREADRQVQSSARLAPEILAAWAHVAPVFANSGIPRFDALGRALEQKVPLEQEMIRSFNEWAAAFSELVRPTLEEVLAEEMIPEFQRALVLVTPELAQRACDEVVREHGQGRSGANPTVASPGDGISSGSGPRVFRGVMWRTLVDPVGGASEEVRRTLPVVDPVLDSEPNQADYFDKATYQRSAFSHRYLADWNNETLAGFDQEGKLSQFANLWRGFTCGELERLLNEEYPYSNLPHVIRTTADQIEDLNTHLELDFTFVGVVYAQKGPELLPGLFRNPMQSDAQTFAQIQLFVPWPRLIRGRETFSAPTQSLGGVPGGVVTNSTGGGGPPRQGEEFITRQGRPLRWDLLNQNWTVQLMPGRAAGLVDILRTPPSLPWLNLDGLRLPELSDVTAEDVEAVNHH